MKNSITGIAMPENNHEVWKTCSQCGKEFDLRTYSKCPECRVERPILYSTAMVQAKLAGTKTVTRRLTGLEKVNESPNEWELIILKNGVYAFEQKEGFIKYFVECPYGNVGDILWVRESYLKLEPHHVVSDHFAYKADKNNEGEEFRKQYIKNGYPYQWKPSIHMPKIAARIWDEIIEIKVERLHDITEEDAIAEGVGVGFQLNAGWPDYTKIKDGVCELTHDSAYWSYSTLWESINRKKSWDLNPWVWVIRTKTLSTNGKPSLIINS